MFPIISEVLCRPGVWSWGVALADERGTPVATPGRPEHARDSLWLKNLKIIEVESGALLGPA